MAAMYQEIDEEAHRHYEEGYKDGEKDGRKVMMDGAE